MSCGPVGRGGGAGRRRAVAWAAAGASRRPPHPLALTLAGATAGRAGGSGQGWDPSALPPLRSVWKFIREEWEHESRAPRVIRFGYKALEEQLVLGREIWILRNFFAGSFHSSRNKSFCGTDL